MIECREIIGGLLSARTPTEIQHALDPVGLGTLFWQCWDADRIRTWDGFPRGFLATYYGTDADRMCAYATAVRRGWESFTFGEAAAVFGGTKEAREAEQVWRAFDIEDGIVIRSGRAMTKSILVFGLDRPAQPLFTKYGDATALAASRMNAMLMEHEGLIEIPRKFFPISEKQREVLRVTIEHPEMTTKQQAAYLGISLRMLEKRHAQIAARFGVSSFAGAVAIAAQDSRLQLTND